MSERINMLQVELKNNNFELVRKYKGETIITYDILDLNEGKWVCELIYQPNNINPLNYRLYQDILDYYYDKPFECIKCLLDIIHDYM